MKKSPIPAAIILISGFLFSNALFAQEKTKVIIKVEKDGETIVDTAYAYDDENSAKHIVTMAEALSENGKKMTREIKEDSLIWITEKFDDGDGVKVIKKEVQVTGEGHDMKKVYVITSEGGEGSETFDVLEDCGHMKVMKISEGEGGIITIVETEDRQEKRVEVTVIKEDEGQGEWTVESDGEEKVIIIKKEKEIGSGGSAPEKHDKNSKKQK